MAGGSPTAFLLWSILACLVQVCAMEPRRTGRPGAFKRIMTDSYLGTVHIHSVPSHYSSSFGAAFTWLKFQEGDIPLVDRANHGHVNYLLKELTFWLFLQNQGPRSRMWFDSWEFKLWLWGSMVAILGMPMTALIARKQLDICFAWILFVGSAASTCETLGFLFVLFRFPAFIRKVKDDGAAPNIIVRLVYSYQLNKVQCGRIAFRFVFSVPLLVLGIDGVQGSHPIAMSPFWPDFLLMLGGVGCFVSSGITLLDLHAPRPILNEKRPQILIQKVQQTLAVHTQTMAKLRMRVWDPDGIPTPCADESPSPARYVFDHRSQCLVRSHSDGHSPDLDPYIRRFRSPIDIDDIDDPYNSA
ncbi:hypothetical protein EDC04DRAFT_3095090 [Pisolithus marmoratus]|nr:hypothetical protein EDC04DRAFT_3095090 [Pisolithus marmoratus]